MPEGSTAAPGPASRSHALCSPPPERGRGDDSPLLDRRQQTGWGTSLPALVTQECNSHLVSERPYCPLNSHI